MSFKDTLKKHLTSEVFTQVVDALGDDFDFDMVPRSRLNKVIGQRNALREELAKANTKGAASDDDDDDDGDDFEPGKGNDGNGTPEGFVSQKELKKLLAQKDKEHEKALEAIRKKSVVTDKLKAKGATDPDTILAAGLLKLDEMSFGEDGTLSGVDDAIENLVKTKAYFFGTEQGNDGAHEKGTGKGGEGDKGNENDKLDSGLDAIFGIYSGSDSE